MEKLIATYQQRIDHFGKNAQQLRSRYDRLSFVRLAIFIIAIALTIFFWTAFHYLAGIGFMALFIAGFYRFVLWHQRMLDKALHQEELVKVNQLEIGALNYDYQAFPDGTEFVNPDHPYAYDLDIFGPYSFFQYCNRTATRIGRQRLACFLGEPADTPEVLARQAAVAELKDELDWRQHFQAYGRQTQDDPTHLQLLRGWLKDEPFVTNNRRLILAMYVAPFWFLLGFLLWIFYIPWQAALLFLIPPGLVIRKTIQRVNDTHRRTTYAEALLTSYAGLIEHIESKNYRSEKLQQLGQAFSRDGQPASTAIRRLAYIIAQLNVRYNVFAIFLNIIGLWDLQWVYRLEKWKARWQEQLPAWFDALSEFEALASLANLHHNNPDWTVPEILEEARIEAKELGHPLIAPAKRVGNDIGIPTRGHIKLITGSNMAGKSTFLRTVGINIVLALAGAPVCAQRMRLPQQQVYTSMRTQDALHESTSSFYAELKRLKFIIEAVEKEARGEGEGRPVFFLLDEILKGTNSVDRHTGSKALIRQLIRFKGAGIIATHDLELGELEATSDGAIENLRIEVEIRDGQLYFDYKLKPGVSESFNATILMEQMGIRLSFL